jgi:cysteinyl-tRNA synthetase, unknown class
MPIVIAVTFGLACTTLSIGANPSPARSASFEQQNPPLDPDPTSAAPTNPTPANPAPANLGPGYPVPGNPAPTNPAPTNPALITPLPPPVNTKPTWNNIKTWAVQYHGFRKDRPTDLSPIVKAPDLDMVVLGRFDGWGREWEPANINNLKKGMWVLSYLSAGQAQSGEWYWNKDWKIGNPAWILNRWTITAGTNTGAYNVAYWNREWQNLMLKTVDRIIANGFDGVFLDQADSYWNPEFPGGPSLENQRRTIDLVCKIATYARGKTKNQFKIVTNGTVELISQRGYTNCWDGISAEQIWYFSDGKAQRASYRDYILGALPKATRIGKKVFTFDFTGVPAEMDRVRRDARSRGFIPFFTDPAISTTPKFYR